MSIDVAFLLDRVDLAVARVIIDSEGHERMRRAAEGLRRLPMYTRVGGPGRFAHCQEQPRAGRLVLSGGHRAGQDAAVGPEGAEAMSGGGTPHAGENDLATFLARIRAGDEDAARELLQQYEAEVRLVVRRQLPRLLRSRFDSLDFLQSVWGDFFQKVRTGPTEFTDSRHLVAFLARAAKNKVIDQYRRAGSLKQDMYREEPIWSQGGRPRELEAPGDTPSQVVEAHEALDRLLELLPADRRGIVELKAEGLSSREIGERLGISERTVQRVLEELRRRVEDAGELDKES